MDKPRCCIECDFRLEDKEHGDYCILGNFGLMDNRFTYEAELNKLYNFRDRCCPITLEAKKNVS